MGGTLFTVNELACALLDRHGLTPQLVPRSGVDAYEEHGITKCREWIESKTGQSFTHIGSYSISSKQMRGNIENPIGAAQVPLGIAGPLAVRGTYAQGIFYIPMATTEGALVRSYERGMVTLTRAGGAVTRIYQDENRVSPVFLMKSVASAYDFTNQIVPEFTRIKEEAESTTSHGELLRLECHPIGREVIVTFCYSTADAHGMNMIVKATERACRWILKNTQAQDFYLFSGLSSEKRGSGALLSGGKGKKVTAGATLSAELTKKYLHTTPARLVDLWHHTILGHLQGNSIGYNAHYANGLAALFIACGQDVANILNSAVGITNFELLDDGQAYVSVTLPSLTVGTVGGGTGSGTGLECLRMLGVAGTGGARKLAEIVAATLLAGEISMAAAIASHEFTQAHDRYGRNRPEP
jgi:hydroxymethylglutaryl-CoA reductase (NADPH)